MALNTLRTLVQQALALKKQKPNSKPALIGESEAILALQIKIDRIARSQAPVLISGEIGVGKELVAKQIQLQSSRAEAPFIAMNCGALATESLAQEFFGEHGVLRASQLGTLFLDDIDCLPLPLQIKLLQTIQDKSISHLSATENISLDVRIIAASHKNLNQEVAANRFRNDLLYRINVVELHIPALRERRQDIPLLAQAFLNTLAIRNNEGPYKLSTAAKRLLSEYAFPGNVLELENILERALAMANTDTIEETDLQFPRLADDASEVQTPKDLPEALEQLERAQIQAALEACRFNKTKAAVHVGITFRALRYKMQKLGME